MATRKKKGEPPVKKLFEDNKSLPQELAPASHTGMALAQRQQDLIDSMLNDGGLAGEIKVSFDGTIKIRAQDAQGATMTLSGYVNARSGYQEGGFSSLPQKLSPSQRRDEVRRLAKSGMSQQSISERLGVSQKTVSNDMRKD